VRLLSVLVILGSQLVITGCGLFLGPVLPPVPPAPDVLHGQLLFVVPANYVVRQGMPSVFKHRKAEMPSLLKRDAELVRQIMAHEIVTGMTSQEVIWSFLSHPTRIVDVGPPGSHIMLWDQGTPFVRGRYWVRTDEDGEVWSAGRY
jgi:hypothetical protein